MLIRKPADIPSSEITPESVYLNRRKFIGAVAAGVATSIMPDSVAAAMRRSRPQQGQLEPNTWEHITTYNNFYEFGTGKSDPYRNAQDFETEPWTVTIEGECHRPGAYQLEDFLSPYEVEDRVYRMRCVEAWSMVIPWRGVELNKFISRAQPTANAKYVAFTTLFDPQQMPGQRSPVLEWPYVEGLRMDEAMHPLTLLVNGIYGRELPNQNGAPLRLVVPWKYGFKGIKSIVKIRLVEEMPPTSWSLATPNEYGFYANVNPNVDHPRWSQAYERRLPSTFRDTETLMFNGYADQVASMYEGMDLRRWY